MPVYSMKSAIHRGVAMRSKQLAEQLVQFVHTKKLPEPIDKIFSFSEEEVHAAYEALQSQSVVGKIAIKVD